MNIENPKTTTYKDLVVWKNSHSLVLSVYKISISFPKEELFGLTSQTRRSSISITSNIAESYGRKSNKEKSHFFQIALGSLYELDSQIMISRDVGYISNDEYLNISNQIIVVSKLLHGIIKSTADL
jgi:four helix bundle protein